MATRKKKVQRAKESRDYSDERFAAAKKGAATRKATKSAAEKKFDEAVAAEVEKRLAHTVSTRRKKTARKSIKRSKRAKKSTETVSKAPLVGKGKDQFKDDKHPNWVHVDKDKTLVASVDFEQFPPELRLMVIPDEPHMVWLKIREEGRRVFGGNPLIIPCKVDGAGMSQVHYELVDEHHVSGQTFKVYRKYSNRRRIMERAKDGRGRPIVLPG